MAVYLYKAMNAEGAIIRSDMEADHLSDLEARLRSQKLDLIHGKEKKIGLSLSSRDKPSRQELINFCFYLEQLQGAGVPLVDALKDLRDSLRKGALFKIVAGLIEHIESGKKFSDALALYPHVFSNSFIALIHAGEESGEMQKILHDLSESLKWQDELIVQSKKALTQPAIMLVVVTALVFFMMTYLVPELIKFIQSMGHKLPLHTVVLIYVSDIFVNYWAAILAVPIITVIAIKVSVKYNEKARFMFDRFKVSIPIFGTIVRKIILARFSNYFALLYAAGIPVLQCLTICRRITDNKYMEQALEYASSEITAGKTIHESLADTKIFPSLVIRMIKVGEASGRLDESLKNVSYFYKREVDEAIDTLQSLIQPTMTVIIGAIIGWIMLSVLGPLYDLIGKIG